MRRTIALLFVAALAAADEDAELARTVESLVRDLGDRSADVRTLAQFRLAALGDRIRPLLECVQSDDPEVRRAIHRLTRRAGELEIELLPRTQKSIPIGGTLVLEVRLVNKTEQTISLLPTTARQTGFSPFRIRVAGTTLPPFGIDEVNWGTEGPATVLPGASRRFRLSVGGAGSPLRRPALYDVSVVFDGMVARGYGVVDDDSADTIRKVLETPPIQVHVLGRKPEELEQALKSAEKRDRDAAIAELGMRDDEAIVPILRRHALERPLRLAAVRQLGAHGASEDYRLVLDATRDEDIQVRRAAVLGLANYPKAAARSRLLLLAAEDHEVQSEAIQALRGHKHHATVDRYLQLLDSGTCSPANVRYMCAVLYQWTGLAVDSRPTEIAAFRAWWEANRADWAEKNASDK